MKRAIITIGVLVVNGCGATTGGEEARARCEQIYAIGATLAPGVEDGSCFDVDGEERSFPTVTYTCDDGTSLTGNQFGSWRSTDRLMLDLDLFGPTQADIDRACSG